MIEKQKLVQDHVDRGNTKAAVELLFELIDACAKAGDFEAAESMRSRIVSIDPMAFREIIRSGEIIEEEKKRNIDANHRQIWAGLYDRLSLEEANALYFGSQKASYEAGEAIFQQGDWAPRLYLVDSGRAHITYSRDGGEFFLKAIEAGQFTGEDVFFSLAVCTTSMIAQSSLELRYLEANLLKGWKIVHPALESKLLGFVAGVESTSDLLKSREMDRRRMRRLCVGGKATALLINFAGVPAGNSFLVDLCDISQGGVCFMVRISKREDAGRMLGNRLRISYSDTKMGPSHNVEKFGTVVGIQFHPFEDCTVNVKFDELLPEGFIELLEKPSSPPSALDF